MTVALHDVGKLSINFQNMMTCLDDPKSRWEAVQGNYRHEVAGLWFVGEAARSLNATYGLLPGDGLLEVLAVAGHHKYLADGYLLDEEKFQSELSWMEDPWKATKAAYGLAKEMFASRGWNFPLNVSPENLKRKLTTRQLQSENPPYVFLLKAMAGIALLPGAKGAHLRDLFLLLKGLLMTADWMASGAHGQDDLLDASRSVVRVGPSKFLDHLRERVERKKKTVFEPSIVQKRCCTAEGHVLAIAPTGSGKTEAAMLWALGQVERGNARKIFFLLPTMVTANSIHDRFCDFFESGREETSGHKVGLVHSTSDLVKQKKAQDEEESDRADVRTKDLGESHFFRPVTVGTVDQLLVPLFHAGRWAMKTFAAADAAIVIDEVHAYDPHTSGLIVLMIKQLRELGARFMIMSATMPSNLRETMLAALGIGNEAVIEDEVLLNSARNEWSRCDEPLSVRLLKQTKNGEMVPSAYFHDLFNETNDRGEPLKILIVVNTVKRCQELAQALHEFNPMCYHSKFIFQDRRTKEELINRDPPRLLIATQVVEVSLDIDYDILLTECAPIDALIQRAGRINRARRDRLGRVIVHPAEKGSERVYADPTGILDVSWSLCPSHPTKLTERALTVMVEEAYFGRVLSEIQAFQDIQNITRRHQENLSGVLDTPNPSEEAALSARLSEYLQISVIPECFHEKVYEAKPGQRRLYELKMPAWYAKTYKVRDENPDDLAICRMEYDPIYGGRFMTPANRAETGTTLF